MAKVLIVSCSNDIHSSWLEPKLQAADAEVVRLNTDEFLDPGVELTFSDDERRSSLTVQGRRHLLRDITAVWYRRPETVKTKVANQHQRVFAENELGELLRQVYALTFCAHWVSNLHALDTARRKTPQLHVAKRLGIRVPRTLVSNAPDDIKAFAAQLGVPIVYKTLYAPVIKPGEGPELWGVPTTVLEPSQLKKLEIIRNTGGIFQEYIQKSYELRVTVIGDELFAAKIDSQAAPSGRIDWRDAVAFGRVAVTPYSLPAVVASQCMAIVRHYGLAFGAIDLIRTPDGQYVFLELNCNGQWLWVEEQTGQPLSDAMVRNLTC